MRMKLDAIRLTFPDMKWASVFRWLFADERVKAVIRERLEEQS
jgi:hypothetical protein